MSTNKRDVDKKASEAAKKARELLNPSQQYAIATAAKNLRNGAFWGFVDLSDIKEHLKAVKSDPHIQPRKIMGSCIIEVDPEYIFSSINQIDPTLFEQKDYASIQASIASAIIEFEKFLVNKGISTPGFTGTIGIYSTNKVDKIVSDGISYPAFRLTLEKTLTMMNMYGYEIKVGGKFISVQNALQNINAVWDSLKISPTRTAVITTIRSTASKEQLQQMRKQLKAKYGSNY